MNVHGQQDRLQFILWDVRQKVKHSRYRMTCSDGFLGSTFQRTAMIMQPGRICGSSVSVSRGYVLACLSESSFTIEIRLSDDRRHSRKRGFGVALRLVPRKTVNPNVSGREHGQSLRVIPNTERQSHRTQIRSC